MWPWRPHLTSMTAMAAATSTSVRRREFCTRRVAGGRRSDHRYGCPAVATPNPQMSSNSFASPSAARCRLSNRKPRCACLIAMGTDRSTRRSSPTGGSAGDLTSMVTVGPALWWHSKPRLWSRRCLVVAPGKVSELEGGLGKVALQGSNEAVRMYIEKIREDRDALNRCVHGWCCPGGVASAPHPGTTAVRC